MILVMISGVLNFLGSSLERFDVIFRFVIPSVVHANDA